MVYLKSQHQGSTPVQGQSSHTWQGAQVSSTTHHPPPSKCAQQVMNILSHTPAYIARTHCTDPQQKKPTRPPPDRSGCQIDEAAGYKLLEPSCKTKSKRGNVGERHVALPVAHDRPRPPTAATQALCLLADITPLLQRIFKRHQAQAQAHN